MNKLPLILLLVCGSVSSNEVECLAKTIYSESRGEELKGQIAVGYTVINRKKQTGKSVCRTVSAGYTQRWIPTNDREQFVKLSSLILTGKIPSPIGDRDSFDAYSRRPMWARHIKHAVRIGNHTFYRSDNDNTKQDTHQRTINTHHDISNLRQKR